MGGALGSQKAESLPKVQVCANSRRAEPVLGTEGADCAGTVGMGEALWQAWRQRALRFPDAGATL